MSHYATSSLAPRTLTESEVHTLLRVSGQHARGFRDHVLFAVALGTGLREFEIVGLDVGDVFNARGGARTRVVLRIYKRSNANASMQELLVPDPLRAKFEKFRAWKEARGESLADDAPLFMSQHGKRLSTRQLRTLVHVWQRRAGFDRTLGFHALRHTACTGLYRRTKDIRLTQRFARHASIASTVRYTHASDDDLARALEAQAC